MFRTGLIGIGYHELRSVDRRTYSGNGQETGRSIQEVSNQ